MGSVRRGNSRQEDPRVIGCIVCDAEDEQRARNSRPGEKPPRSIVTEAERDEALARLFSGEAYREHEEIKAELFAAQEAGTSLSDIRAEYRRTTTSSRSGFHYEDDDEPEPFEDFAW